MDRILIYRSTGIELAENELSTEELRKSYEVTDDWFVKNVRVFVKNQQWLIVMIYEPRYGRYSTPGGKVDVGETREEAAYKELKEELWITPVSLERIGCRKSYLRGSKWINKWFARYCIVYTNDTPSIQEHDKATELIYVDAKKINDKTTLQIGDEIIDDPHVIYDRFPGLHTLLNVAPYLPSDPIEWATFPYEKPDTIDPEKTYSQRYLTKERKYIVEEDI